MIQQLANELKIRAINTPMVNQSSFGDISLYDNKATIKYPYVNIDVVNCFIQNHSIYKYKIRFYICDRNEPYIAYNKTEMILVNLLTQLQVDDYTINYFTFNFKDKVHGVWADIDIENINTNNPCFSNTDAIDFVLLETGDLINKNLIE